jgi:heterodisulfide reductase subunit B
VDKVFKLAWTAGKDKLTKEWVTMLRHVELSDYQLWMCKKIKEKLAEKHNYINCASHYPNEFEEREVISIALSEMLMKLDVIEGKAN